MMLQEIIKIISDLEKEELQELYKYLTAGKKEVPFRELKALPVQSATLAILMNLKRDTVTRYLNGTTNISENTIKKIEQALHDYGRELINIKIVGE